MPYESFRQWAASLEDRGDLLRIDDPVSTKYEIAAYTKKSCDEAGPAFRFTNVEGHDMDVFANLFGAKRRVLDALGVDSHQEGVEAYQDAENNRVDPVVVDDGPVKEVFDSDPDLEDIPIVHHSEHDTGHYITAGVQVADLPHTGVHGQGVHRMVRKDSKTLGLWAPEERRVGYAYRVNGDEGEPTELAIVIAPQPAVFMGSIANVPHSIDKYSIGGAFRGEPVELVECETIDVRVPANAEMVIETKVHPEGSVHETAFGEYPGTYSYDKNNPEVEVTGIMRREDAIYHTVLTGFPPTEDNLLAWIPRSGAVKQDAERAVPSVDQAMTKIDTHGGNGIFEATVSIDKRLQGDPWNVAASVLGGRSQAKVCMVVDDEIDIYDPQQVSWAFNTRVQPQRDIYLFPTMVGAPLDPSGPNRQSQKMAIDATVPLDEDHDGYQRVEVPGSDDVEW
jgi:UbiD family decarboxylase